MTTVHETLYHHDQGKIFLNGEELTAEDIINIVQWKQDEKSWLVSQNPSNWTPVMRINHTLWAIRTAQEAQKAFWASSHAQRQ